MFRQIAPNGIVSKVVRQPTPGKELVDEMDEPDAVGTTPTVNETAATPVPFAHDGSTEQKDISLEELRNVIAPSANQAAGLKGMVTDFQAPADNKLAAEKGEMGKSDKADIVPTESGEMMMSRDELRTVPGAGCPFSMNK